VSGGFGLATFGKTGRATGSVKKEREDPPRKMAVPGGTRKGRWGRQVALGANVGANHWAGYMFRGSGEKSEERCRLSYRTKTLAEKLRLDQGKYLGSGSGK